MRQSVILKKENKMQLQSITFQNNKYVLVGEKEGAIATKEQIESGTCSFAHLYPNGDIMRFQEKIGMRKDIVFGDMIDVNIADNAFENMLLW